MNKGLWFLCGAIVGASVTYLYLSKKNKDEEEEKDEFEPDDISSDSFMEVPETEAPVTESFKEVPDESFKEVPDEKPGNLDRTINRILEQEPDPEERKRVSEYIERVKKYNKASAQEFSARTGAGPYVIDPNEYGDFEDYDTVCLTYFADGVLVDDAGDIMSEEEIDESVGKDFADYFGVYENDLVVIRNDERCADYHIERDLRNSSEADEVNNNPPIIDWGDDD